MKKLTGTPKRCVFRVLLILLIVAMTATGCAILNLASRQPSEPPTGPTGGIISCRAEPYINPGISWEYSLDIKIKDDKIYINDTLYEESSSVPPAIVYSEGFLATAKYIDEDNNNQEMANMLEKIKNCNSCYLIETDQDCKTGQMISVYEIDGAYYFVRFYDTGEVMRIHCATIE